jgi:hypothetical protein
MVINFDLTYAIYIYIHALLDRMPLSKRDTCFHVFSDLMC